MEILFSIKENGISLAKIRIYDWYRLLNGIAFTNHKAVKFDKIIEYDYNYGEDYIQRLCYLYDETYTQKIWYIKKYDYYYIVLK